MRTPYARKRTKTKLAWVHTIAFDSSNPARRMPFVPTVCSHISAVVAWPCVSARMYPRLLRHRSSKVVSVSKSSAHAWRNNVQRGVHLAYSIRHYTCRTTLPYAVVPCADGTGAHNRGSKDGNRSSAPKRRRWRRHRRRRSRRRRRRWRRRRRRFRRRVGSGQLEISALADGDSECIENMLRGVLTASGAGDTNLVNSSHVVEAEH